jgi:hypothetical protein
MNEMNKTPRKNPRSTSARRTKRMAICAIIAALGVVIMGAGALIEIMDLSMAALASLLLIPVLTCYGKRYAMMTYAVTGILSLILMPQSLVAWLYLGLLGYYVVLKERLDRMKLPIALICKVALLVVVLAVYLLAFYLVFMQGSGTLDTLFFAAFAETGDAPWMAYVIMALAVVAFFLYDFLIGRLVFLYRLRWQRRVEKWMR